MAESLQGCLFQGCVLLFGKQLQVTPTASLLCVGLVPLLPPLHSCEVETLS